MEHLNGYDIDDDEELLSLRELEWLSLGKTCVSPFTDVKFSSDNSGDGQMTFSGYASVFGNIDAYGDVIEPGAFAAYLSDARTGKQPWPAMLSQHGGWGMAADDMTPIGVWTDLAEDGTGLKASGTLADTPRGRELYTLMKMAPRPAIDGLSIGYIPKEFEPRSKPEDPRRRLKRVDLIEISPVTFPANRLARVSSVKSIGDLGDIREIESFLREVGKFSRRDAKGIIARIKATSSKRDALVDFAPLAESISRTIKFFVEGSKHD